MPEKAILHVDMDAFFAAVEVLDAPGLAGRPLIVGGTGRRGVVASCTYEARAYGVRSAMPTARARQLCPHAVVLPGRHARYAEVSERLRSILTGYTPLVEMVALDEAFLDVSAAQRLFGPAPQIAAALRRRVAEELHLSCSVGVASVKFLAKLASEAAKPKATLKAVEPGTGVFVVPPGGELGFLHPHSIEALWGVGPATAAKLRRLGIATVGDLAAVPPEVLEQALGKALGRQLHRLAWAIDERPVEAGRGAKSISCEETYAADLCDRGELGAEVLRLADAVGSRLARSGMVARTVTLKVRYGDFTTITRSRTLPVPVSSGHAIAAAARCLLDVVDPHDGVRLLGVGVSRLRTRAEGEEEQLLLDLDATARGPSWEAASQAVEALRSRFGPSVVGPAAMLRPGGVAVKRPGDAQWGPG